MTNKILTPGYVKWDSTKYILDPILPSDRTGPPGPPGTPGGTGPIGPAGAPGPAGSSGGSDGYTAPFSIVLYVDNGDVRDITFNLISISAVSPNIFSINCVPQNDDVDRKLYVGKHITISGAASPGNNGTFLIVGFVFGFFENSCDFHIYNPNGVSPDANDGSIVGTVTIAPDTHMPEGASASISSFDSLNIATITGLTNINAGFLGKRITVSGAASPGNVGGFTVTSVNSATSVNVYNTAAVAPDANNGSIKWTFRDGSIQKPFKTIQSAIDSTLDVHNIYNVVNINLLVAYGYYPEDVQVSVPHYICLAIVGIVPNGSTNTLSSDPGYSAQHGDRTVRIGNENAFLSIFSINSAVGRSYVTLNGVFMGATMSNIDYLSVVNSSTLSQSSEVTTFLILDSEAAARSNENTSPPIINLTAPVRTFVDDMHDRLNGLFVSPFLVDITNYNPFNNNFLFNGLILVSVYISINTPATSGSLNFFVEWAGNSQQVITGMNLASATSYASAHLTIAVFDGPITYSATGVGLVGTANFNIDFSIHSFNAAVP